MERKRQIYIANNGLGNIFAGIVGDVAEYVGATVDQVYRHSHNGRLINGWRIERQAPYTTRYIAFCDTVHGKRTCVGTAAQIARWTEMSENNIRRLARTGKTSWNGWRVELLSNQEGVTA